MNNDCPKPKVLILILNYKSANQTLELVMSSRKLAYDNYSILIVDNCSPDNSKEVLLEKQKDLGFDLIINNSNKGYAVGNNIGLNYSIRNGYKYTFLLNSDVIYSDYNILNTLVHIAESDDKVAGVGPQIIDIDGNPTAPYVEEPSLWDMTLGVFSMKNRRMRYVNGYTGYVYRIYGCCMLLDNNAMKEVGLFDESTFLYSEEEILAERLKKKFYRFYYTSSTSIIHLESMIVKKELGDLSWKKLKMKNDSLDVYLKEYRHFNVFSRFLCKLTRTMINIIT